MKEPEPENVFVGPILFMLIVFVLLFVILKTIF